MSERRDLVRARRRVVSRVGLIALFVVSAAAVTACIFEKGDYQGGGRLDKGATAKTADPQPTVPPSSSSSAPTPDPLDAATGG